MERSLEFFARLDAHDRGLLCRWSLDEESHRALRWAWIAVTHLGGAFVTIASVVLPLWLAPWPRTASWRAALTLVISHLLVQLVKRRVNRPRPELPAVIRYPDRFSFPSGHATAALAVALSYAVAFPSVAVPLIVLGILVGFSRVALGVHYPGDVLVGQCLAAGTVLLLAAIG